MIITITVIKIIEEKFNYFNSWFRLGHMNAPWSELNEETKNSLISCFNRTINNNIKGAIQKIMFGFSRMKIKMEDLSNNDRIVFENALNKLKVETNNQVIL